MTSNSEEIIDVFMDIKKIYIAYIMNITNDANVTDLLGLNISDEKRNVFNNMLIHIKHWCHNHSDTFKNITDKDLSISILYTFYTLNLNGNVSDNTEQTIIDEFYNLLISDDMRGFFLSVKNLNIYEFCQSLVMCLDKL